MAQILIGCAKAQTDSFWLSSRAVAIAKSLYDMLLSSTHTSTHRLLDNRRLPVSAPVRPPRYDNLSCFVSFVISTL